MDNICNQYIRQVKTIFPIMGKKERAYMKNLSSTLEDFCVEESISSLDVLYAQFGTPLDTVNNYFSTWDASTTIKRISTNKWRKRIAIYLLVLITCFGTIFCIHQYRKLQIYEREAAAFIETTIE